MNDRITSPTWPMLCAWVCVVLAAAAATLAALAPQSPVIVTTSAGYALGALFTTAFASAYRSVRDRLRSNPRFRPRPGIDRLATSAVVVGFLVGMVNAFLLATELAK